MRLLKRQIRQVNRFRKTDKLNKFSEFQLEIAYKNRLTLSPVNFIEVLFGFSRISKTSIKSNFELYKNCVSDIFIETFGINGFPFYENINYESLTTKPIPCYCNYSFPKNIQFVNIKDFYSYSPFFEEVNNLHKKANLLLKKRAKNQ